MTCDICGSDKKAFLTEMEGAKLYVCDACNPSGKGRIQVQKKKPNFKKPLVGYDKKKKKEFKPRKRTKKFSHHRYKEFELDDYDLVENYGQVLRKAREEKNLTLEDLAKKMRESISYINKIELGKLKPSDKILLKIYDILGVNLVKAVEEDKEEENKHNKTTEIKEEKKVDAFTSVTLNNKKKLVL